MITKTSHGQKPVNLSQPRMLTPSEIEFLRTDKRETLQQMEKLLIQRGQQQNPH